MRKQRLTMAAIITALLLITVPVLAGGVHNVSLTSVGSSGVTGLASTIVGSVAGSNPYQNVEVNLRIDQAPASQMVYQGWLVDSKDNIKTSIGAFKGSKLSCRQQMVNFDTAPYDSIAVSLEPANSTSLTPTTVVAQGSLPGTSIAAADFPTLAVLPDNELFAQKAITSAFNKITPDQFNTLRMQGWGHTDIALMGNVAARCNKQAVDIASMLSQGESWDQIASSCGTTTAMIFEPYPTMAVAGSQQVMGAEATIPTAYTPGGVPDVHGPMYYRRYANGRQVITRWDWIYYRRAGYSWQEVAIAANIASQTGEDPGTILRRVTVQGETWWDLCYERGLNYKRMMDTSGWPFSESGTMPTRERPARAEMGTPPPAAPPAGGSGY